MRDQKNEAHGRSRQPRASGVLWRTAFYHESRNVNRGIIRPPHQLAALPDVGHASWSC